MNATLKQLFFNGPTWDGNLVSKAERDDLVRIGWGSRTGGWNFLTIDGVAAALDAGLGSQKEAHQSFMAYRGSGSPLLIDGTLTGKP